MSSVESTDSFFVQWATHCLPDENKYRSLDLHPFKDQAKVRGTPQVHIYLLKKGMVVYMCHDETIIEVLSVASLIFNPPLVDCMSWIS